MKRPTTTHVLWAVYIGLLAVLLPHTAWAFGKFEPDESKGVAWAAAFAFEAAIAALTHKLTKRLEHTPNYSKGHVRLRRAWHRYANTYTVGLVLTTTVSALANSAHAVEFRQELVIFTEWSVSPRLYTIAFGAVLPLISVLFAAVLSKETETETPNVEPKQPNAYALLSSPDKRQRILAARKLWPKATLRTIAEIANASASYVNGYR